MTPLHWHRLASGIYEARIGPGERDRYRAERIDPEGSSGYGTASYWVLTYPGAVFAYGEAETLRDAKYYAARHYATAK